MKAGTCELDITPAPGGEVPGQWLRRVAGHVRDPLSVTALVLESRSQRAALVSCDVLSLKNRIVADLRSRLSLILDPRYLLLTATHTHTGPPVCDALGSRSDESCIQAFTNSVEEAVRTAFNCLEPARIGWTTARAPGFAFPRRWRMADSTVQMHPRKDDPDLVEPEGEADDTLTVVWVCRADDSPLALCINFACHPTVVGGGNFYSADYPGAVRRASKKALGDGAAILFLNGPCGDVGPDDVSNRSETRHSEEWMERIGAQLAARAVELAARATVHSDPTLAAASQTFGALVRGVPKKDLRAAQRWADEHHPDDVPTTQREVALRELILVEAERRKEPTLEIEIAGLRIGDGALVALPGEVFAAIGRDIRAGSPFAHTAVVELANGCYGYVPTAEAFEGGGYETWLCRSSRLSPETGAQIAAAGQRVLRRLAS